MMINLTKSEFQSKVIDATIPVVLDFYADWCPPCRALTPLLDTVTKEFESKIMVYKVNVEQEPDLTAQHNVSSIPVLVFYKNKTEVNRIIGLTTKDKLVKQLDSMM